MLSRLLLFSYRIEFLLVSMVVRFVGLPGVPAPELGRSKRLPVQVMTGLLSLAGAFIGSGEWSYTVIGSCVSIVNFSFPFGVGGPHPPGPLSQPHSLPPGRGGRKAKKTGFAAEEGVQAGGGAPLPGDGSADGRGDGGEG